VLLIVNVASRCGFTPQYKHLQKLHEKLSGKNFSVLAFPCNDFSNQEPGSENKILEFCGGVYGVTFDIFEKVKVRGVDTQHLYRYLESEFSPVIRPKGVKAKLFQLFTLVHFLIKERRFPHAGEVMWNFHKNEIIDHCKKFFIFFFEFLICMFSPYQIFILIFFKNI